MKTRFDSCLKVILKHEGGFVNHPRDPGGATNLGITKKTYEKWLGYEVDISDIMALNVDNVTPIYKKNYWDRNKCEDMPVGLDLCLFDFSVNAGTYRAAKTLQSMIGATSDGIIGPKTLAQVDEYLKKHTIEDVIEEYQQMRLDFYRRLSSFDTFGRGWTKRVHDVTLKALTI